MSAPQLDATTVAAVSETQQPPAAADAQVDASVPSAAAAPAVAAAGVTDAHAAPSAAAAAAAAAAAPSPAPATAAAIHSSSPTLAAAGASESSLRSSIRTLLLSSDLTQLTPKLVRAHLARELSISDDAMEALKKQVKTILHEEMERVATEQQAKNGADAGKAAGRKHKAESSDGADEPAAKKAKKGSSSGSGSSTSSKKSPSKKGSATAASAASEDADIERMAAEAEDGDAEGEGEGSEAAAVPAESQEDADARMAAELSQEGRRPRRAAAAVNLKPPRKAKAPKDPNAAPKRPPKPAAISATLAAFFDHKYTEMNRGEIVRLLWVYVKEHQLQDPKDGRRIILDDRLKTIFGENRKYVDIFGMNKHLQKHVKNKDQLTG